jgi:hypothetical protein
MARQKGLSKTDALQQVLDKLGLQAKPSQVRNFVKKQFGLEISLSHVSNIRSGLTRRVPAASRNGQARGENGISLEDILAVKSLVQRIGAENLHALVNLVST